MTSQEEQYTSLLNRIDTYETRLNHTYTALGHHIYADHHDDIITVAHLIETIANQLYDAQQQIIKLDEEQFNKWEV